MPPCMLSLKNNTTDDILCTQEPWFLLRITICQIINFYHDVDGPSWLGYIHCFLWIWILRYPHSSSSTSTNFRLLGPRKASHGHPRRRRSSWPVGKTFELPT